LESDDDEEDLRSTNKLISPQKTSSPQKERASRNSPQKASSQEPALRRSQRERRSPSDFWIVKPNLSKESANQIDKEAMEFALMVNAVDSGGYSEHINTPQSYQEAQKSQKWREAMKEKYDALMNTNTWKLMKLPAGRKAIGCKWTYKLKENADGTIARHKARLVAKGYTQQPEIDFTETYASVVKFTTIRTMLALAALKGYNVTQMDVTTAYLHADVETELYMKQPEGFEIQDNQGEELVCKLLKSLYGLKQAGHN
jgi:hypothetical protein